MLPQGMQPAEIGNRIRDSISSGADVGEILQLFDQDKERARAKLLEWLTTSNAAQQLKTEISGGSIEKIFNIAGIKEAYFHIAPAQPIRVPDSVETGSKGNRAIDPKKRARYLRDVRRGIENILRESIHGARFIDLGIKDAPDAIRTPLLYENPEKQETFDSLWEAFKEADHRLLVLGEPGSGKSTSLYHLGLRLVEQAEANPEAPIPFIENLSLFPLLRQDSKKGFRIGKYKLLTPRRRQFPVKDWLINQLKEKGQLSSKEASRLVQTDGVAFLLDGLDEVTDTRRVEFAVHLNQNLLETCPDLPIVVCSRTYEYLPIKEQLNARLRLKAAAILQPLDERDIFRYVQIAQTPALETALREDPELMKMANSPLILSLMTLAYSGSTQNEIRLSGSPTERRHSLMASYISKMLQRTERKMRGKQTDAPGDEVPQSLYRYSAIKVNDYLGRLAILMSVRMRTSFKLQEFYSFLNDTAAKRSRDEQLACSIAQALLVGLFGVIAFAPLIVLDASHVPILLGISFFLPLTISFVSLIDATPKLNVFAITLMLLFLTFLLATALAQTSWWVAAIIPQTGSPLNAGMVAIVSSVLVWTALLYQDLRVRAIALALLSAIYVPLFIKPWSSFVTYTLVPKASALIPMLSQPGSAFNLAQPVLFFDSIISFTIIVCVFCFLQLFSQEQFQGWCKSLLVAVVVSIAFLTFFFFSLAVISHFTPLWTMFFVIQWMTFQAGVVDARRVATHLLLPLCISIAVGIAFRRDEPLVFVLAFLITPMLFKAADTWWDKPAIENFSLEILNRFAKSFETKVDRLFLTPVTWQAAALTKSWPWRRRRFFRYCTTSMILHQSADCEFAHRLLRDYFALRQILPLLKSDRYEDRLQAIESLAFQGDAAIETLIDLTREGETNIAVAAATSLGRIASIEALSGIREAVRHKDPLVRSAMLANLSHVGEKEATRLIRQSLQDADFGVLAAALRAFQRLGAYRRGTRIEEELEETGSSRIEEELEEPVLGILNAHPNCAELLRKLLETGVYIPPSEAPDWVFPQAVSFLIDADLETSRACMLLLCEKKFRVPVSALRPYLLNSSLDVRQRALRTICACAPSEASEYLIWALLNPKPKLQKTALDCYDSLPKGRDVSRDSSNMSSELRKIARAVKQKNIFGYWFVLRKNAQQLSNLERKLHLDGPFRTR